MEERKKERDGVGRKGEGGWKSFTYRNTSKESGNFQEQNDLYTLPFFSFIQN